MADTREAKLVKAGHTFIMRCPAGEEDAAMTALADLVKQRELPFDWFDAAVMSHQLGQQMRAGHESEGQGR